MPIKLILTAFSILLTSISFSQEKEEKKWVKTLCSDSLWGRGYVHQGVNKAAQFIKHEFIKAGLQPVLADKKYLQPFDFNVNTFPSYMKVIVNDTLLKPGVDYLVGTTSGSFNGELKLINVDTNALNDPTLLNPAIKALQSGEKNGFLIDLADVKGQKAYTMKHQFNTLATIGTVVYLTSQKLTWSVDREQMSFPIIHVQNDKLKITDDIQINIKAKLKKDFPSNNVIGVLPSKDKNADTIVFTAHYDHLGIMGTIPDTTLFPGGNDNASGTAMLLSLANYFSENPTNHTLMFIAFAGEEAGLLGSQFFVHSEVFDLSTIHFLINIDIMGSGEEGITVVNGTVFKEQFQLLQTINEKQKYISKINERGEAANSDHWFFYKAGVPSIFIYTMGPNKNYHDIFDTYEALSFAEYNDIICLLVDFVEQLK